MTFREKSVSSETACAATEVSAMKYFVHRESESRMRGARRTFKGRETVESSRDKRPDVEIPWRIKSFVYFRLIQLAAFCLEIIFKHFKYLEYS